MLIHFLEGARLTQLVQLIAGIETPIASGTQYEMTQKSEAVAKLWIEEEQFRRHPEDKLLWESCENTVALAKALGFSKVYDPNLRRIEPPSYFNATGEISLDKWVGARAKNGAEYKYAIDNLEVLACPSVPLKVEQSFESGKDFASSMLNVIELQNAAGGVARFTLA